MSVYSVSISNAANSLKVIRPLTIQAQILFLFYYTNFSKQLKHVFISFHVSNNDFKTGNPDSLQTVISVLPNSRVKKLFGKNP